MCIINVSTLLVRSYKISDDTFLKYRQIPPPRKEKIDISFVVMFFFFKLTFIRYKFNNKIYEL